MKKQALCIMMTALLSVGMLSACGNTETGENTTQASEQANEQNVGETTGVSLADVDVESYVTLGEYKGLEVTIDPVSVDEDELNTLMSNVYSGNVTAENGGITDRAVEVGDTVNMDYEGKQDGVAFDGGTATGATLTIGSGQFIDGFEDGLIGVMPGETVDLTLTFPEDYPSSTELAGQTVVFTVTVHFILPDASEMDDAVIAEIGIEGVSNVEEFRQYVYDYLYANGQTTYDNNIRNYVVEALMQVCTFAEELPAELVAKYEESARASIEAQAASYGVDVDTFTNYFYGVAYEEFIGQYSPEAVQQMLALQAIANSEDLNLSDEELEETLLGYATESGYATVDEFLGETTRDDYREYLMSENVLTYLVENAVITNP